MTAVRRCACDRNPYCQSCLGTGEYAVASDPQAAAKSPKLTALGLVETNLSIAVKALRSAESVLQAAGEEPEARGWIQGHRLHVENWRAYMARLVETVAQGEREQQQEVASA